MSLPRSINSFCMPAVIGLRSVGAGRGDPTAAHFWLALGELAPVPESIDNT